MKRTYGAATGRFQTRTVAAQPQGSAEDAVREMKAQTAAPDYRERSLALHGLICARCGREFSGANRKLLTVHHKDSNAQNNPPDGSNWENLCVYCHDMEHSRELLGDYEDGRSKAAAENPVVYAGGPKGMGSLGELLASRARKGK